ncbi:hypothetical protein ETAA8_15030 [Anatilimnocola aggregata]|uniref:Uncharacterized protein n=1 Tax=Anatilimnocola aggregata TaxID=2528021 RepID=A0A517Y8A4_9BACT|nr:hypothetical protein [Anatilimnocola aggregata]QDU26425.1 hypothetical protein ETAA8_15030 [Anatilimnocola aggregata]
MTECRGASGSLRFSLRTLLIAMLLAGPLCAVGWKKYVAWQEWKAEQEAAAANQLKWQNAVIIAAQKGTLSQSSTIGSPIPYEQLSAAEVKAEVERLDREAIFIRRTGPLREVIDEREAASMESSQFENR